MALGAVPLYLLSRRLSDLGAQIPDMPAAGLDAERFMQQADSAHRSLIDDGWVYIISTIVIVVFFLAFGGFFMYRLSRLKAARFRTSGTSI